MTGAITFEFIAAVVGVLMVVGGIWFKIEAKINANVQKRESQIATVERVLHERINQVARDVNEHKIETMREYASVGHLEKVEGRLITAIEKLTEEVKAIGQSWPKPG